MERIKKHIGVHHISTVKSFFLVMAIILSGVLGFVYSIQAYPEIFRTEITLERKTDISPTGGVTVNFSLSMPKDTYESLIKIEPQEKMNFRWENSNKRLVILPDKFWKPETEYTLRLPESKNIIFGGTPATDLVFNTVKYPKVKSFFPENGSKDVVVDIEDPIVVSFDKSTDGFFIKFVMEPESEMTYQNNLGKTEFKLLPKTKIEDGVKYGVKIYAKYAYDPGNDYRELYNSFFETKLLLPVAWEKDFTRRLEQARKYTVAKISTGKYIDINLSAQILSIFEDGKMLDDYMISSGKPGMPTQKGPTKIYNKFPRAYSRNYGLYMPYWMALAPSGKFGIHELPEWPNGYKEGAAHLGIPVSHGCVRLGVGSAKRVYEWAEVGTPAIVY